MSVNQPTISEPAGRCFGKWINCLWFLGFSVASSVWCVTAGWQLGATFDEPFYISNGLHHWRTGSYRPLLKAGTMPLPIDVETLPIYAWERYRGVPFDANQDFELILPWARAGMLVFWWLLLAYAWRIGQLLAGSWGARLAVALLACEPSLLAHAGLATTDIAVAACLLAFVYHFRTGRRGTWLWRIGIPAFWLAATILAKASGMLFGPICLVVLEIERHFREEKPHGSVWREFRIAWRACRGDCLQILLGGMILVFLYCGSDWQQERSFTDWARQLPDNAWGRGMVWMADHLKIFSNAGEGLVQQVKHNIRGHGAFLLGHTAPRAIWYYFPVLLSIKLTASILVVVLLLALIRASSLSNWACLAACALLVFSLTYRVQIGIRLVLPLVALGIIGVAAALVQTAREGARWQRMLAVLLGGSAICWAVAADIAVWPDGISYVNELWGGTRKGYSVVSESNYDWGQGLKELARWQQQHQIRSLDLWYFGSDPAITRMPWHPLPLHNLSLRTADDVLAQVQGNYLAVSTTILYGSYLDAGPGQVAVAYLRRQRPVARTITFLIYDFTGRPAMDAAQGTSGQRPKSVT
jgi:hypothetical protein